MNKSTLHAACAAAALAMLGACTTEPTVAVNTTPMPATSTAVVVPAPAGTTVMGAGTFSATDRDFALGAARSNMLEIGASEMAMRRTSTPEVRNLAATIHQDHTTAYNELAALMNARGVALPPDVAPHQRSLINTLGTETGDLFDHDFVTRVGIQSHQADIALFQRQMTALSDPALRDWAARTLPHMQMHLQMAQDVYGHMAG